MVEIQIFYHFTYSRFPDFHGSLLVHRVVANDLPVIRRPAANNLYFCLLEGQWETYITVSTKFWGLVVACRPKIFWNYWLDPLYFLSKLQSLANTQEFLFIGTLVYTQLHITLSCKTQTSNLVNCLIALVRIKPQISLLKVCLLLNFYWSCSISNSGPDHLSAVCWLQRSFISPQLTISLLLIMGQKFRIPQLENSVGVWRAKGLQTRHFS